MLSDIQIEGGEVKVFLLIAMRSAIRGAYRIRTKRRCNAADVLRTALQVIEEEGLDTHKKQPKAKECYIEPLEV